MKSLRGLDQSHERGEFMKTLRLLFGFSLLLDSSLQEYSFAFS